MLHKFLMGSILFLVIFSCDSRKEDKIEDVDLSETEKSIEKKQDNKIVYSTAIRDQWIGYYKSKGLDIVLDKFKKKESFDLVAQKTNYTPIWDKNFDSFDQSFLRYNGDSTQYVDFLSYKIKFDDKNELYISPDQEVVLVNVPKQEVKSILFYGPSYWIEDVYFKNDSILVLLENSTDQIPAYQEINLNTLQSDYYTYPEKATFESNYLKNKILTQYQEKP